MDLATFFSESIDAARSHHDRAKSVPPVPVVPAVDTEAGNDQVIDNNNISRSSRSSRSEIAPNVEGDESSLQACARTHAGERARTLHVEGREQREQREQPAGSDTYSSRSLSLKRELERETGTEASLPAASPVVAPSFEERAAFLEYECGLSRTAAEAQAVAETGAVPTGAALWRAALTAMSPDRIPCPGYRGDEWARTLARAIEFLDTFGAQAEALGWTAPRLFGVHRAAGIVRVDCCGGLVLPGAGAVRAITATEISFGHLTHREKPGQSQGVPIWEFGR